MKIKGRKIQGPHVVYIVIPRQDEDIGFHAQAVLSMEDFYTLVELPEPPTIVKADQSKIKDYQDREYLKKKIDYNKKYNQYIMLKSLEATPGLEWETVNINDPSTWDNLDKEFIDSGISEMEVAQIRKGIMEANALDDEKLDEARQRFLVGLKAEQGN